MNKDQNLASLLREAKKTIGSKGEVSTSLRRRLGEDMAQMFDSIGRKLFADIKKGVKGAIGSSLQDHKQALQKAVVAEFGRRGSKQAEEHIPDWLEEIVGDAITAVAKDVYEDLDSISDLMLAETPEEEKEPSEEEPPEDEEEGDEGEEGDMDEGEEEDEEEKEAAFEVEDKIQKIKAAGLALATKIASSGNADVAARIRVAMRKL